jgi:uncharacterized repeat protein (TIGR01451 family)/fimbrial isopeptide formation D2 family protein
VKNLPERGFRRAPRRAARRALLSIASLVMAVAPMVSAGNSPAVQASGTPSISLSESAPATILYGTDASVSLTASNATGGVWGYNLSYEDVLPAGVSYVAGSTSPASVGDPQILANEPATHDTTLIWSNVSDLSSGSSNTLDFSLAAATDADPTPDFLPNESYTDTTSAYVNTDPREVPQFTTGGTPSNDTGSATASGTTTLSPLATTQTPGGDHLRGIHDHQFVSTITVTNNDVHATNGITVDDWLPAGLEYLLCGQTDNTTDAATNPGSVDEYPGSPSIVRELGTPSNCLTPATVATANTDPDGSGPLPTAVYTHVEWTGLGNLAPSASLTIEFVTAIPIRANTMTWTGSAPIAASLGQSANLDNNSGAETANGEALTIFATATGTYSGTLGSGANPVEATGYDTVIARDLDTTKTVSNGTFDQDDQVAYTITVNTSEYRYSDDTTVTDTLPSGLCPLGSVNYDAQAAPECAFNGSMPSPAYASVTENANGTFTLVWDLGHMAPSTTENITFPAVDRVAYQSNYQPTTPTVGNDSLTNTEVASGNLSVRCGGGNPNCTGDATNYISHDAPITVDDVTESASATQTASGPTITAYVSQNVAAGQPLDCATATYLTAASAGYPPTYQKGDDLCFKVDVSYPPGTDFKNPTVTDFIPPNTTLVSEATTAASDASNVSFSQPASGQLQWTMGSQLPTPDGSLYEAPGTTFEVEFSVIATADPTVGSTFNLTQDLAKLVTSNTLDITFTVRDLVTYQLAAPIVTLTKAVTTINTGDAPESSGDTVHGGDSVGYTVTVKDTGIVNAYDVEVWDVLPVQDDCADLSAIVPGSGACVTGSGGEIIEWPPSAIPDLAAGTSTPLAYTVTVPPTAGAGEIFSNTAGVRSFVGEHNDSGQPNNLYYPEANIDPSVTSGEENATAADQAVDVVGAGATVTKTAVTSITTAGNTNADATIGETITYTVDVTVPHDTTFYTASLADPLGTQQTYVTGSGVMTLPDGTVFDEGSSAEDFAYAYNEGTNTVDLTFPPQYPLSPSSTDEVVKVVFSTLVANVAGNLRNDDVTNVATLTDYSSRGVKVTASNPQLKTLVVEPDVTIAKTVSPAKIQPGGTNTFTITVTNQNLTGVSSAFDLVGTDTIPVALTYVSGSVALGGPVAGTASEAGGVVTWSIPGPLNPGQADTITYEVNPPASGSMTSGETFPNTATLTSWQGVNGGGTGTRSYGPASSTVTLDAEFPNLVVTKSTPDGNQAFANQPFTWEVSVENNTTVAIANSLAVTDTLPGGWTYDTGTTTVTPPSGPATHPDPAVTVNGSGDDVLSWTGLGTLNPGKTLTIVYAATPALALDTVATTGPSYPYANQAYATATDNTGSPGNGSVPQYTSGTSTADAYVGRADLQITKSHTGNFSAGATGTYSLTVVNSGPSTAAAPITVTDTMVSPEQFQSVSGTGWVCIESGAPLTITCTSSTALGSGATAPVISVVVKTPSSTPDSTEVTNTASVNSPTWDNSLVNNTSSDPTTIDAEADLAISKSHTGSFTAGGQGTYTISIENNGPSDAVGPLSVTDTLPGSETLVSATGTGWTCGGVSAGHFTCTTAAGLTDGSFAQPITEVVAVSASQLPGSITNGASVSSPTNNPDPANATSDNPTSIVTSADLALTKLHEGTFVAGQNGTYDFTVTNGEGPSDAAGPLMVTDPLPSGETFVSGGGGSSGWSCSASSGTVTCTDTSGLDVGGTTSFTLTVALASSVTVSTLTNQATLSSPTTDPVLNSETSTDNAGTTQLADLQVIKTLTTSLVAGQDATYSLAVSDNGPSDAAGTVIVTDTLPTGESYQSAIGTGWICGNSGALVTCSHQNAIVAGAPASLITVTVGLASDVPPGSVTNTATITQEATPDPDAGNNTSAVTASSTTSANLSITKSDHGPFTAGDDGEYYINVSNAGPSDAQDPLVTDTLPSGETYVGATGAGWVCSADAQVVTCADATNLVAGTSAATIDLTVAVSPSLESLSVTNDASVSSSTSDPNESNNSASDTTTIDTSADLAIVKTHTGSFDAGSDGTYTLTVTNHGPSDAELPLQVTDDVPSPFTLVSASGGSAWDCTGSSGNDVSCVALAPLPTGSPAPAISVVVSIPSSQTPTTVTNTASVTSATRDPDGSNNSSSDPASIVTSADLWVTKTHQGTFTAGDDGSYMLAVGNLGPSDAAQPIVVSDTLPASETFASATGAGWTCSNTLQVVTCTDPDNLPSGEDAPEIDLAVAIASDATGSVSNTATVASTTSDPVTANDSGSDTTSLALSSDLSITKTHTGDFTAGRDGTYTIGVHNVGPSDSGTGVVVSDTLPTGEAFVSAEGAGWICVAADPTVTCTLGTSIVVAGDATSLELTVAVKSCAVGTLTNVAVVQGPNPDPLLANNTASDPTASDRVSNLSLTKTLMDPLQDRANVVYAFAVTNAGPSDSAAPVTVTDPLPAGLTYVSNTVGSAGAWSCAAAGQTVTCTDSAPVAAGTTSNFDIKVAVSAGAGSEITNTATVAAAGDVGAAAEFASADGGVLAAASVPDSGASAGSTAWPLGALLLVIGGLGMVAGSRRRWHLPGRGRAERR